MVFPFKEKGFPRKSLCFLCGCASAVLAKISSLLYREFFQQVVSEYRFDWEQWPEKKERRQELRSLTAQTLAIGRCKLKIICMGRNYIFLFWGVNQIVWKKKNGVFLIDRC